MSGFLFFVFYIVGMVPTYILPYFGSNSYVAQTVSAIATGSSMGLSGTILHAGALGICLVCAWARGSTTGKTWLLLMPILAGVFDLAPGLNIIPFVPTIFHLIALSVGMFSSAPNDGVERGPDGAMVFALLMGVLTVAVLGAKQNATNAEALMGLNSDAVLNQFWGTSGSATQALPMKGMIDTAPSNQDRNAFNSKFARDLAAVNAKAVPGATVQDYKGWRITQMATQAGTVIEAIKDLQGPVVGTVTHAAPLIGVLCSNNKLDARIQVGDKTTGIRTSTVTVEGALGSEWTKGTDTNLFPPEATAFVRFLLQKSTPVRMTISYEGIGPQTVTLDVTGLAELVAKLPANCRP